MMFLLLNFLQPQTRLSWVVIVAAVLAFAAGVALLVYFYKRYKRIEKETENDWDLSRHSLFVDDPPAVQKIEEADAPASVEAVAPVLDEPLVQTGGTREFASDLNLPSFASAKIVEPEPQVESAALEEPVQPEPRVESAAPEEPVQPEPQVESAALEEPVQPPSTPPAPRPTEILASPSLEQPVTKAELEAAPFDEEIWADLEIAEQQASSQPPTEPLGVARVEEPAHREPFELPGTGRVSHREERMPGGTVRFGSASEGASRPERETRELAGELVATAPVAIPDKSISASAVPRSPSFGSILGLPAESSHQPLILGEPVRPDDETGIGALTHYGQDLGPKGGRAGKIALVVIVALLCGAAGLYFFVPSVNSQVGAFIARLRGTQTEDRDSLKPKAQIIPSSRPEVNKNMVTARGAVDNISDQPLVKLEVEVSLQRGADAPPEIRRIAITPDVLPTGERGTFEFEYDGKRDTGFAGYTITRLFSNGTEVRFRTPAQK